MATVGQKIGVCTCLVLTFIVAPVLIAESIVSVDDGFKAVLWGSITQEFHGTKGPGLHVSVPGVQTAHYSRRVVALDISNSRCVTREGIDVSLNMEAQFTLIGDDLVDTFRLVGEADAVSELVDSIARHAVLVACGNITAQELFISRAASESVINQLVVASITEKVPGAQGENAPVRNIELPEMLVQQLRKKDDTEQEVELEESRRDPVRLEAENAQAEAKIQSRSLVTVANARKEQILFKATKDAETVVRELEALGERLADGMRGLNFTARQLLTEVLQTQQRGEEQTSAMQLCMQDCQNPSSAFSCGICYLTQGASRANVILNVANP
jgi:hypothetical protein